MSIFAIGDLHLAFNENKPMYIFGDNWINHELKIEKNWKEQVNSEDLVILPGDFSWSMYLGNTVSDFQYLNDLPGKKLLLKGNHDYWWNTVSKMRKFLKQNNFNNIDFLYNNSYSFGGYIIAGSRGWSLTDNEDDKKMIKREALRLNLSLNNAIYKYGSEKEIIVVMHYPPITNLNILLKKESEFVRIMKNYNVKKCIYGHLHGTSIKDSIQGIIDGIEYRLVSADSLDFNLLKIN